LATEEIRQSHQIWCRTVPAAHAENRKPEDIRNAHYQLGLIYEAKGLYSEARTHLEEVIKEDPTCQDALDVLTRVLEKECIDSTQIYYNLAKKTALWVGSRLVEDKLEKGKSEKWQAERLNRLGYLFMKKEMYGKALKMFIAASEKYPRWFMSYWNMGDIYSYRGQQPQSVEAYEKALELVKEDSERYRNIQVAKACSLLLMGKEEEARSTVNQIKKEEITDFSIMYNLACYYSHAGERDDAMSLLKKIKPQMTTHFLEWVKKDPDLRNIQVDPKFQKEFS
jgi:tetratricopeptide (TPR) repeat protein